MSAFRVLSERVLASPQIDVEQVSQAAAEGVVLVINNRPEGESADQTPGAEIEEAARAAGMGYVAIPIDHSGFGQDQVRAMISALETSQGKVLAYCRSGTRSTFLWALAQASIGEDPAQIAEAAAAAGYDVGPISPMIAHLAAGARG